jgi:dimethylaniline monooxygenase (N-oxide forming)
MSKPTVCIIGAGSSGIATAKELHQRGISFDCFDGSDRVGGNWVFKNANRQSSSYEHLHINTSRERMEYSDFPMPKSYPDFPHHTQIADYFEAYVDHFGFRHLITFETWVRRAHRRADGVWEITLHTGETREYDALVVANGHHWDPRWPEPDFPGDFDGEVIHSHDYTERTQIEGRDVVVLGMGNSAMDIANEASHCARSTVLAARRGAHILPKYLFGRPMDQIPQDPRVPYRVRQLVQNAMLRWQVGKVSDYGLPEPDHRFGEAHPTVSSEILSRIAHGTITVKPNISRLAGDSVEFVDGSRVPADLVIYCTGYKVSFPFFDPDFFTVEDNEVQLFHRVFAPGVPDLFFVGLLQPLGAVMPLAEAQSRWIADYLLGFYALPGEEEQWDWIRADREGMAKRYVSSKRHTIQVDFEDYLLALDKERKAGAKRAAALGHAPPVSATAGSRPLASA